MKWNDFQQNVTSCFLDLKGDKDFTDVTLACEDRTFEAHKVILSTCSPFLRSLLKKTNKHPHPLVYLRGVKARVLEAMLDFIYQGEANIVQEDLDGFLLTAEEFQLNGLTGNNGEPEHAEGSETQDGLVYCRWPLAQKMSSKPIEIIITIIDYYINQSINRNNMKINQ